MIWFSITKNKTKYKSFGLCRHENPRIFCPVLFIVKRSDNIYYTGVTSNIEKRIIEHQSGFHKDSYTYKRRPIEFVYYTASTNIELAIEKEKQIKKWSKAKKEALIKGEYEKLPNLAKKKF